jgi:hypothetical protein
VNRSRLFGAMKRVCRRVSGLGFQSAIPAAARSEMQREQQPEARVDISIDMAVSGAVGWLERAQDNSLSADGGVARHYSLSSGWGASYPETTGYIVPTLISEGRSLGNDFLLNRTRKMLNWLVDIQMPCGAFQGSSVDNAVVVPVTFNTGQILLGLAAGVKEFGPKYRDAMMAAANWLVETQDPDGCWRKYATPFAIPGEKTYETHVAWGLFEAARLEGGYGYGEAAMRNVYWALTHQNEAGWFANCCLTDPSNPLTHTIGYVLRGLVEAYRFSADPKVLRAAIKTAEGVLGALRPDGFLPGRLDSQWRSTATWSCLTGTEQIAACWLLLYRHTRDERFRDAAISANRYVRETINLNASPETRGAVKGSFPVSGEYERFQYPSWACKFLIDANRLEQNLCQEKEIESPIPRGLAAAAVPH